eukprot:1040711-Prorocentrum_minimum.AAC.1
MEEEEYEDDDYMQGYDFDDDDGYDDDGGGGDDEAGQNQSRIACLRSPRSWRAWCVRQGPKTSFGKFGPGPNFDSARFRPIFLERLARECLRRTDGGEPEFAERSLCKISRHTGESFRRNCSRDEGRSRHE